MDPANVDEEAIGIVRGSPSLLAVLGQLYLLRGKPGITQSDLARYAEVSFGHMSEHMRRLQDLRLAWCTKSSLRKCKPYSITEEGVTAWEAIQFARDRDAQATEVKDEGKVSKL